MFIGLCKDLEMWPHPLRDLGYNVELIEQEVTLKSTARRVSPDVVAASKKSSHVLVSDCKGGRSVSPEQDARYRQLAAGDLEGLVDARGSSAPTLTVCYVALSGSYGDLSKGTDLPFIVFDGGAVEGRGDFGNRALNEKMHARTSVDGAIEPTSYYAFSLDDDDYLVIPAVLRAATSYLSRKGRRAKHGITRPEISEAVFTHMYMHGQVGRRHKGRLVKRIRDIIGMIAKSEADLAGMLTRVKDGDRRVFTSAVFEGACNDLIARYDPRTTLDSYTRGTGAPG